MMRYYTQRIKGIYSFSLLLLSFTHTLVCECARNVIEQVLEDVDYLRLCMMGLARIQMPMNMPPHHRAKEEHTYIRIQTPAGGALKESIHLTTTKRHLTFVSIYVCYLWRLFYYIL